MARVRSSSSSVAQSGSSSGSSRMSPWGYMPIVTALMPGSAAARAAFGHGVVDAGVGEKRDSGQAVGAGGAEFGDPIVVGPDAGKVKVAIRVDEDSVGHPRRREQHLGVHPVEVLVEQPRLRVRASRPHLFEAHPWVGGHGPMPAQALRPKGTGSRAPSSTHASPRRTVRCVGRDRRSGVEHGMSRGPGLVDV